MVVWEALCIKNNLEGIDTVVLRMIRYVFNSIQAAPLELPQELPLFVKGSKN